MNIRRLWLVLLLALCAMQAHALLHVNHDATSADPSCLSCKLHADLSGGAAPGTALLPITAAETPLRATVTPDLWRVAARLRPPLRGPPPFSKV